MERRFKMDWPVKVLDKPVEDEEFYTFYLKNDEIVYAGKELRIKDIQITYYVWPIKDDYAMLFEYLGDDTFDDFFPNIDSYNEEVLKKTFPILMRAAYNGLNKNFSESALIPLKDVTKDDGYFWGIGTRLENIEFPELDTEYVLKKALKLHTYAIDLLTEMKEKKVSNTDLLKMYGKAAIEGYRKGSFINKLSIIANNLLGM